MGIHQMHHGKILSQFKVCQDTAIWVLEELDVELIIDEQTKLQGMTTACDYLRSSLLILTLRATASRTADWSRRLTPGFSILDQIE
ncbi:hypothetical protein SKAU_G00390910 [Synaphobranchus kaupii]|uniref:Uncharacterized protein n=1 Tax=Synaphobranchus kaupii TaxID=118154 RepID=A0A9Q1EBF5_SYNKA|nr:hypothetical protein SKAU_G00390910 [Synaphobranchus kaupii]